MANASSEDSIRAVEEVAVHFKKFFRFNAGGLFFIQVQAIFQFSNEMLRYDFINHLTVYIRQPEWPALELISKFFMIKT